MNDNSEHPLILSYRNATMRALEQSSLLSRTFLLSIEGALAREQISPADALSAWNEFIAASVTPPSQVIFAAPEESCLHVTETMLEALGALLTQTAAQRGLLLDWQVSVRPAIITKQ